MPVSLKFGGRAYRTSAPRTRLHESAVRSRGARPSRAITRRCPPPPFPRRSSSRRPMFPRRRTVTRRATNPWGRPVRREATLLVGGEANKSDNRIFYPVHPERRSEMPWSHWWEDVPSHPQGAHDGKPDALRAKEQGFK